VVVRVTVGIIVRVDVGVDVFVAVGVGVDVHPKPKLISCWLVNPVILSITIAVRMLVPVRKFKVMNH
jgi:hypothetical protein